MPPKKVSKTPKTKSKGAKTPKGKVKTPKKTVKKPKTIKKASGEIGTISSANTIDIVDKLDIKVQPSTTEQLNILGLIDVNKTENIFALQNFISVERNVINELGTKKDTYIKQYVSQPALRRVNVSYGGDPFYDYEDQYNTEFNMSLLHGFGNYKGKIYTLPIKNEYIIFNPENITDRKAFQQEYTKIISQGKTTKDKIMCLLNSSIGTHFKIFIDNNFDMDNKYYVHLNKKKLVDGIFMQYAWE